MPVPQIKKGFFLVSDECIEEEESYGRCVYECQEWGFIYPSFSGGG